MKEKLPNSDQPNPKNLLEKIEGALPEQVWDRIDASVISLAERIKNLPNEMLARLRGEESAPPEEQSQRKKAEAIQRAHDVLLTKISAAGLGSLSAVVVAVAKGISEYPESKRVAEVWLAGGMVGAVVSAIALSIWYVVEKDSITKE